MKLARMVVDINIIARIKCVKVKASERRAGGGDSKLIGDGDAAVIENLNV